MFTTTTSVIQMLFSIIAAENIDPNLPDQVITYTQTHTDTDTHTHSAMNFGRDE
jgi:hypothetical protein